MTTQSHKQLLSRVTRNPISRPDLVARSVVLTLDIYICRKRSARKTSNETDVQQITLGSKTRRLCDKLIS